MIILTQTNAHILAHTKSMSVLLGKNKLQLCNFHQKLLDNIFTISFEQLQFGKGGDWKLPTRTVTI